MDGVILTPLKIIPHPQGDVLHAIKSSEPGFAGFGEAYFSTVKNREIKAWKRHKRMTLNLVVPSGCIKFVLYDDRRNSSTYGNFFEVILSKHNYMRLTVPSGIWSGFQGLDTNLNLLLNIANIEHDPTEADSAAIDEIAYDWGL
ncbi:MAG: dTDP-4-dehydrorhamnose 3,5-epimerase family protein [Nitrospirae bacterium]|nr:dTDP-4-dehydrorhamnose 3,5-epimerase family protein [Nitrospirota bacterium]